MSSPVVSEATASALGLMGSVAGLPLMVRFTQMYTVDYSNWEPEDKEMLMTRTRLVLLLMQAELRRPVLTLSIDGTSQTVTVVFIPHRTQVRPTLDQFRVEESLAISVRRVRDMRLVR